VPDYGGCNYKNVKEKGGRNFVTGPGQTPWSEQTNRVKDWGPPGWGIVSVGKKGKSEREVLNTRPARTTQPQGGTEKKKQVRQENT